jgi:bacteriorhodopsin
MTIPIRTIVLTEVVLVLTIIAVLESEPHPAYVYFAIGVLGLIVQVLAIVSTVRLRGGPT